MKRVPITNRYRQVVAHALVDNLDAAWACGLRWHLHSKGYAVHSVGGTKISMHREIARRRGPLGARNVVHHRDEDPLNNRRRNLEVMADGGAHRRDRHSGRGQGVCFHRQSGRWMAYTGSSRRRRYLGLHDTRDEARAAVLVARGG